MRMAIFAMPALIMSLRGPIRRYAQARGCRRKGDRSAVRGVEVLRKGRWQQGRGCEVRYFVRLPLGGEPSVGAACRHDVGQILFVTPGGIMVPPESPIRRPSNSPGRRLRLAIIRASHFTTVQSLEPILPKDQIKLRFGGSVWRGSISAVGRADLPAVSAWGLTFQFLEQLGFRKVVDTSFMIAFMFPAGVVASNVENT